MKTKERLAQVLHSESLHGMEELARAGRYDDYESEFPTPIVDLVRDLREQGRDELAQRAIDGEWDGSKEEADAWFQREGKDLI